MRYGASAVTESTYVTHSSFSAYRDNEQLGPYGAANEIARAHVEAQVTPEASLAYQRRPERPLAPLSFPVRTGRPLLRLPART